MSTELELYHVTRIHFKLRRVLPCWKSTVRDNEIDDRLDIFKISVSVYRVYAVGREETVISGSTIARPFGWPVGYVIFSQQVAAPKSMIQSVHFPIR